MERKEIIKRIKSAVRKKNPDAEIVLFGSRARGEEHKSSDWDILILHNEPNVDKKTEMEYREKIFDVELETGEAISTFVHSREEWENKYSITPLYQNIKEEGIRL